MKVYIVYREGFDADYRESFVEFKVFASKTVNIGISWKKKRWSNPLSFLILFRRITSKLKD